jgi:hypothetical protein
MDWYTLLLIFLFIVLPLIQQFLDKRRGQGELPPEEEELPPPMRRQPPRAERREAPRETPPAPRRVEEPSWSEEWGRWPSPVPVEEQEQEQERERERERAAPRVERIEERPPPEPLLPVPEPVPFPARFELPQVISLERLEVDREAEHRRLQARFAATDAPPPSVHRGHRRAAGLLQTRGDLRRAVLLAEVLGPPRSRRELKSPIEE